jgi:hypothetical protein
MIFDEAIKNNSGRTQKNNAKEKKDIRDQEFLLIHTLVEL